MNDNRSPLGKTLEESIRFLGMAKTEFAGKVNLSETALEELMSGTRALTPELALCLESVTGTPANLWKRLESKYRRSL
ncbi:MAG: XRE family transcriptional regulator [Fibrobacter sp.]|jgi:HTH-type transcriptional regulator/antitoxin HigA|nr:XRE family transcriptional regulator [Fibrobacter sp.]